jgi:small subunit ribosomal protein S20
MPHTKSAQKNLRKTEKRRLRNRAEKKTIRTFCKRVAEVAGSGNAEAAKKELVLAIRKLDKAAAKRVIHPNLAARKKSQLARLVNTKLAAKPAAPPKPTT